MDLRLLVVLVVICGSAHAQTCTDKISGCSFIFCRFSPRVKIQCPKTCGGCPTAWGAWVDDEGCSVTCGGGRMRQRRSCINGHGCSGPTFQVVDCNTFTCRPHPAWGAWRKDEECSVTCGGGRMRQRRYCINGPGCSGPTTQMVDCNTFTCGPDPAWGAWRNEGECSLTCGGGTRRQTRACINGPGCPGSDERQQDCQTQPCPRLTSPPTPDPNRTPSGFNVWSACSKTCGSGSRYRVHTCSLNDINRCPREYEDCNTDECQQKICQSSTQQRYGDRSQCCSNKATSPCGSHSLVLARKKRKSPVFIPFPTEIYFLVIGVDAEITQWPWAIRIEIMVPGAPNMVCGGTLIHRQWILTAAHCVSEAKKPQTTVYVGYRTIDQVIPQIHRVIQHGQFVNYGSYSVNDIALVQLTAPVSTNEHVYPVCLPRGELTPTDKHCYVIGWGSTRMSGPHVATNTLQEGRIRILPFDVCKNAYNSQTNNRMDENMMKCAGIIAGGTSACAGDSGGPLLCQRCKSCDWYVSGLVSFGPAVCGTANRPSVYTNVINFESWIRSHVPQLQSNSYSCN